MIKTRLRGVNTQSIKTSTLDYLQDVLTEMHLNVEPIILIED